MRWASVATTRADFNPASSVLISSSVAYTTSLIADSRGPRLDAGVRGRTPYKALDVLDGVGAREKGIVRLTTGRTLEVEPQKSHLVKERC